MNNTRAKKVRQTFTLPQTIFQRFASVVPEGKRSALVAQLLEQETIRREQHLIQVCQAANGDATLTALENDFQNLDDPILEQFDDQAW